MMWYPCKAKFKYGQGMVEYALILGVVIVLTIVLTNNDILNGILEISRNVIGILIQDSNT